MVSTFFGEDILSHAKKLGYSSFLLAILKGNFDDAKCIDPAQYSNILSCIEQADCRTPDQFAKEITINWVLEDCIRVHFIKSKKLKIMPLGCDSERKFLPNGKINSDADYLIQYNNQNKLYMVELILNHTAYWERAKKFELRYNKYQKLLEDKVILLGLGTKINKFFVINFKNPPHAKHVDKHHKWGKPAYEIEFGCNLCLHDFDKNLFQQKIIDAITN